MHIHLSKEIGRIYNDGSPANPPIVLELEIVIRCVTFD